MPRAEKRKVRDTVSFAEAQEAGIHHQYQTHQYGLVLLPMALGVPESPVFGKHHFKTSAWSPFISLKAPAQVHHIWG